MTSHHLTSRRFIGIHRALTVTSLPNTPSQQSSNVYNHGGVVLQRRLPPLLTANTQVNNGFLEGIVRGIKNSLLTQSQYHNLTQCENLEGWCSFSRRAHHRLPHAALIDRLWQLPRQRALASVHRDHC